MDTPDDVIARIRDGFADSKYPGDAWLEGATKAASRPRRSGRFVGRTRWEDIEPAMLDGHYAALSFFSEAGFRFFLPAFLVADVRDQLQTADPLFHLIGGFHDGSIEVQRRRAALPAALRRVRSAQPAAVRRNSLRRLRSFPPLGVHARRGGRNRRVPRIQA